MIAFSAGPTAMEIDATGSAERSTAVAENARPAPLRTLTPLKSLF